MVKISRTYLNLLLVALVLFFVSRQNIFDLSFLAYFIHIFILISVFGFLVFSATNPVKKTFFVLFVTNFFYSAFLVYRNGLPTINLLQSLITLKFLFVFFIVAYCFNVDRPRFLARFLHLLTYILLVSGVFVIFDYVAPNSLYTLAQDGRGIAGISPGSFFGSRVLFSGFLLLYSIIIISFKYDAVSKKYFIYRPRFYWFLILFAFFLLFLTYSRKELLLLLLVFGISFVMKNKGSARLLSSIFLLFITPIIMVGVWFLIGDSVLLNFNENYVRYKIFFYAKEIFEYYFPFGSGPGTYGTVMSKMYTEVYYLFSVDSAVIGYGESIDGPIFDLFFVSLIAEYGVGVVFVMWFIFLPFFADKDRAVGRVVNIQLIRINGFLMLVGIGIMVPIMGNIIGLLLFFLLGLLTPNRSNTIQSRVELNA